jgi:hypothetical protein
MTQAIDDLLTLFQTFAHTTVNTAVTNGGGTEQLSADPTIEMYRTYVDQGAVLDTNGYVVLVDEQEGEPRENGPSRDEIYVISGFIYYESRTDKSSLMIQSIREQLRSLMNVNNASVNTWVFMFIGGGSYNNYPLAGKIDFNVLATRYGVNAYS